MPLGAETAAFLLNLTEALMPLTDPIDMHAALTRITREFLQADRCMYCEIDGDQVIIRQDAFREGLSSIARSFPRTSFDAFNDMIESGQPLVIDDRRAAICIGPDQRERFAAMQVVAAIGAPVVKHGKARGVLWVGQTSPRHWTAREVQMTRAAAEHAWSAIARARSETALRRREQTLQAMVDASADAVWEADASGEVLRTSKSWQDLTGQPLEASLGRGWLQAVHADDRAALDSALNVTLAAGKTLTTNVRYQDGQGGYRFVALHVVPIRDPQGMIVEWVGLIRDITPDLETVRLKAANEDLQEADRQKNAFLAILGHELRNPLGAIRVAAEMLARMNLHDEGLVMVEQVLARQTELMTRIVDDLLDVSRLAHGKLMLCMQSVDLRSVVDAVLQDRQAQAAARQLQLITDRAVDSVWVLGDRHRLIQVLDNLVDNAMKFTPAGGSIHIALGIDPSQAILSVKDNGIGIKAHHIPSIFAPFHQEDAGALHAAGGLGLGLALVKGLIELHGGDIAACSPGIGQGTEFEIRIPLTTVREPAAIKTPVKAAPHRVLIVEDNPDVGQMLSMLLQVLGLKVRLATNGRSALAMLAQEPADTVLCDLDLPDITGYEVVQAIRKTPATARMHVVALSGYGQPEDKRRTRQAGFDAHLVKPASVEAINAVLLAH